MNSVQYSTQTGHSHLQRLITLRSVAVFAQCLTLALVHYFLAINLPWLPMLIAIAVLASINFFSWLRLRANYPISDLELFAQLCVDVLVLSILLYYGGGSTNPFVSLFLLPLVIAATTLSQRFAWAMAIVTTACYTLLMKYYQPLPSQAPSPDEMAMDMNMDMPMMHDHSQMQHMMPSDDAFNMHVAGMWLGYVISALVIAYFVVKMAQAVRVRDEKLARIREETLRNERIVALGIQAAGAAHELGTPLATLSVVIGELKNETGALPEWRDSLTLLDGQVRVCKKILDKLLSNAQDLNAPSAQAIDVLLADTLTEWQILRPAVPYQFQLIGPQPIPSIMADPTLHAALLNLLNNAADASPQGISIRVDWDETQLILEILDQGQGLTAEVIAHAGSAFFTTKQEGRGLGLFLANATLERLGGSVRLFNRDGGGATTEVKLPLIRGVA